MQQPVAPTRKHKILVIYSAEQSAFLTPLKKILQKCMGVYVNFWPCTFVRDSGMAAESYKKLADQHDYVVCASEKVSFLVRPEGASHDQCAGSMYGKMLLIHNLEQIYSVPYMQFLMERYLKKIFQPWTFFAFPQFTWKRCETHMDAESALDFLRQCPLVSVDIETTKTDRALTCIGFSGITLVQGVAQIKTFVFDISMPEFWMWTRAVLATPGCKTFQNGMYDNLYLMRWQAPTYNWGWDSSYAFHSWYSELPKDLGFLAAFFIRDFQYWKTDGKTAQNLEEYHRYNAKDCYTTLCISFAQLLEMPKWAKDNFILNFPMVFPCMLMNAQGLKVNEEKRIKALRAAEERVKENRRKLSIMTSLEDFNAGSPKQVAQLFSCFGLEGKTDEKTLVAYKGKHPILARLVDSILDVREDSKAISQYFNPELWHGRLYFNMHPAATETSRLACQKSSYWCGAQVQNYPPYAKVYIEADEGRVFVEIDNEQSETRCTAYMAEDLQLIATVESDKDFHALNATKFFGVDYEVAKKKTEDGSDSPPRAMAKKINHAVSYNMAEKMFVIQAGAKFMEQARRELRLAGDLTHEQIAGILIGIFDKAYPMVRGEFQRKIKMAIAFSKRLVSPPIWNGLSWTRWFFNDPALTKPALNAAVAHGPQSTSVRIVNEGMLKIYQHVLFLPDQPVRMSAQIHDSLLFQIKEGLEGEWIPKLHEFMRTPIQVHGRTLIIPTAHKVTGKFWGKEKK